MLEIIVKQYIPIDDDDDDDINSIVFPCGKDTECSLSRPTIKEIKDNEKFAMVVKSITGNVRDGISIGFGITSMNDPVKDAIDNKAFTIIVNMEILEEMINSLQIVYNGF